MILSAALTVALALVASADGDRLLLCRPKILGDPALARAESFTEAARAFGERFLDYGVACDDAAEAARAARRAGLRHAIRASVDGRTGSSAFTLELGEAASEAVTASRAIEVAPGRDAVRPLRGALSELLTALPREAPSRAAHVAAWSVAGAGAAALAAGAVVALGAQDAAQRARAASSAQAYVDAREEWRRKRTLAGIGIGAGGAALAAGLAWRFAF